MFFNTSSSKHTPSPWREYGVVAVIIVVGIGLYYSDVLFNASVDSYEAYRMYLNRYESAMRADTFGGATPEETRRLFVEALRRGDARFASQYFLLDEQGSRKKWVEYLEKIKVEGGLLKLAKDVERAEAREDLAIHKGDFRYILKDEVRVLLRIDMELNTFSGVWKIESL